MHDRWREPPALGVGDHEGNARIHRGDQRIRGAQIYADNFAHGLRPLYEPRTGAVEHDFSPKFSCAILLAAAYTASNGLLTPNPGFCMTWV